MKNKWKETYLSNRTVSRAVFEYLRRRKVRVNRKRGCHGDEYNGQGRWVFVQENARPFYKKLVAYRHNIKNECGKMRKQDNPYEVWQCGDWTWKVLKKYQSPDKEAGNPYSRWFCFVTSPFCPQGEMGDVYVREIKNQAVKVS